MVPSWAPTLGPNIFGWSSPVGLWFTTFRHFGRPRRLLITCGNRKLSFKEPNTPSSFDSVKASERLGPMGPKQALGPVGTPGPVDPNPLSRFQIKKKSSQIFGNVHYRTTRPKSFKCTEIQGYLHSRCGCKYIFQQNSPVKCLKRITQEY